MKAEYIFFLILAVTAGCSRDSRNSRIEMSDVDQVVSTHRELEKLILDYYHSIEEDVKKDLGVSETEVVDRVQSLINEGYVEKPAILIITEAGPTWERVDYATYKEFMTDRASASRRYHGIQPNTGDSLAIDSIRTNLLRALKGDSIH